MHHRKRAFKHTRECHFKSKSRLERSKTTLKKVIDESVLMKFKVANLRWSKDHTACQEN